MRTQCNQRFMGCGVGLAFVESNDTYVDLHPRHVRMPNDPKTAEEHAALCGPVKTYSINPITKEN